MSDNDDGKTIAFSDVPSSGRPNEGIKAPPGRLICVDASQVDGALPENGVMRLIPGAEQTVGRGDTCSYRIPSQRLSRQHARVFSGLGGWGVEDLNSTNGIQVNQKRVKAAWLTHGDEVRFGPVVFRFELDQPAAAPAKPMPAQVVTAGGDDRTMMIGSLGASKAVIDAMVRSADQPAEEQRSPVMRPPVKAAEPEVEARGGAGKVIAVALIVLLLAGLAGGGMYYYPIYRQQKEIAQVVETGGAVVKSVIARARDAGAAHATEARNKEEIALLSPVIAKARLYLDAAPDNVALADLYARASILVFERDFTEMFAQNRLDEAKRQATTLNKDLSALSARMTAVATGSERMGLVAAADLSKLMTSIVVVRDFVRRFPQVSKLAPSRPTQANIQAVDPDRDDFVRLRRLHNKTISIDHPLLNAIVLDVENNDLITLNRWKEFLLTSGG